MLPPLRPLLQRAERFLLDSQLWVFFGVLLAFGVPLHDFTEASSVWVYLNIVLGLAVFFVPVFAFISQREVFKEALSPWMYRMQWLGVFAAYPFVSYLLGVTMNTFLVGDGLRADSSWNTDIFHIIGWVFVAVDLLLHGPLTKKWLPDLGRWFGRINQKTIAGALIFLAGIAIVFTDDHRLHEGFTHGDLWGSFYAVYLVLQTTLILAPLVFLFRFHQRVLYNKLYRKRGLLYYAASIAGTVLVFAPLHDLFMSLVTMPERGITFMFKSITNMINEEIYFLPGMFMVGSVPVIVYLEWTHKTRTIAQLEKQRTDTELTLLKEQLNPHFFFNTLNNLYAQSLQAAPETPDTVLRLSDLMRYVIYRAKEERVTLQEEIDYLRDYLDLQRIRLPETAEIDFTCNIEHPGLKIPPLLFIVLVENAFKHGIEKAKGDCYLQLDLRETAGEISIICRNSVDDNGRDNGLPRGIGLGNLTRRLELLYPDTHHFELTRTPDEYRAELTLWQTVRLEETALQLEQMTESLPSTVLANRS